MTNLLAATTIDGLAARWLPTMLDATIKGTAVLAVAGAALLAMRRTSAAARQLVLLLAMVGLLIVPVVSLALPAWQVLPAWARFEPPAEPVASITPAAPAPIKVDAPQAPAQPLTPSSAHKTPSNPLPTDSGPVEPGVPVPAAPAPPAPAKPAAAQPAVVASTPSPVQKWIGFGLVAWAAGVVVCLLPLVLGRISIWRLKRQAVPVTEGPLWDVATKAKAQLGLKGRVSLFISHRRSMPMMWGILRPALLLPAEAVEWAAGRLWVVMMHELGHVKRWDMLTKVLAHLATAFYWFNPLVWLALRRFQTEAERACDDLVLSAGSNPGDYAEHILDIASGLQTQLFAAHGSIAMARPDRLEGRLLAILDPRRSHRRLSVLLILLAVLVGTSILIPLSILRARDQVSDKPAKAEPTILSDWAAGASATQPEAKANGLSARSALSSAFTINSAIQENVERVLAETVRKYGKDDANLKDDEKTSGVAIVMDPRTGAVLAVATCPTTRPGESGISSPEPRRNRAWAEPFEPGSLFKWVVLAGAIDQLVVAEDDQFLSEGQWREPTSGRVIHEVGDHPFGNLTVRMILAKSSNIGMSKIGLKMGQDRLYKTVTDFGFGQKTGIDPGGIESPGVLFPVSKWTDHTVASVSFGQEIAVTPIQMLTGFCVICNGGCLVRPRLVRAIADNSAGTSGGATGPGEDLMPDGSKPAGRQIISEKTAATMRSILADAVTKGPGQKAQSDKVVIFGKTGTAQIISRGRYTGDYMSSFICGAPEKDPRIAVIVCIRNPNTSVGHFGGTVAAPAVKQIVEDTLAFLQRSAPPATQAEQAAAVADRFANRIRTRLPNGWSVGREGGIVTIKRDKPVEGYGIISMPVSLPGHDVKADMKAGGYVFSTDYAIRCEFGPPLSAEGKARLERENEETVRKYYADHPDKAPDPRGKPTTPPMELTDSLHRIPNLLLADSSVRLTSSFRDSCLAVFDAPVEAECGQIEDAVRSCLAGAPPASQPATFREIIAARPMPNLADLAKRARPDGGPAREPFWDILKLRDAGDERAVPVLSEVLTNDAGKSIYGYAAAQALYCIGGKDAMAALDEHLFKLDEYTDWLAAMWVFDWDMLEPKRSGFIQDYLLKPIGQEIEASLAAEQHADGKIKFTLTIKNVSPIALDIADRLRDPIWLRGEDGRFVPWHERGVADAALPAKGVHLKPGETLAVSETGELVSVEELRTTNPRLPKEVKAGLRIGGMEYYLDKAGDFQATSVLEQAPLTEELKKRLKLERPWAGRAVTKPVTVRLDPAKSAPPASQPAIELDKLVGQKVTLTGKYWDMNKSGPQILLNAVNGRESVRFVGTMSGYKPTEEQLIRATGVLRFSPGNRPPPTSQPEVLIQYSVPHYYFDSADIEAAGPPPDRPIERVRVNLSATQAEFEVGQPIRLTLTVKNTYPGFQMPEGQLDFNSGPKGYDLKQAIPVAKLRANVPDGQDQVWELTLAGDARLRAWVDAGHMTPVQGLPAGDYRVHWEAYRTPEGIVHESNEIQIKIVERRAATQAESTPARPGEAPVYIASLGTVTPFQTVTIRPRVDGQLVKVVFKEGAKVQAGDLLAEMDSAQFQAQLKIAEAQLARDEAGLANAKGNLKRLEEAGQAVAQQMQEDAKTAIAQSEGTVRIDLAQVESAKLQVDYCHIRAPISGVIGMKLVDEGQIVRAADKAGLAVINQVEPINVEFTLPQVKLPEVVKASREAKLSVQVLDHDGKRLATGTLSSIDNQIDTTAGTVRLKATFENKDHALFPGQFVNVRLQVGPAPAAAPAGKPAGP